MAKVEGSSPFIRSRKALVTGLSVPTEARHVADTSESASESPSDGDARYNAAREALGIRRLGVAIRSACLRWFSCIPAHFDAERLSVSHLESVADFDSEEVPAGLRRCTGEAT